MRIARMAPLAMIITICVMLIIFYPFLREYNKKGTHKALMIFSPIAIIGIISLIVQG